MAAGGLHISISAEPVMEFGSLVISNSMLTSVIVSALLVTFAVAVRLNLKPNQAKPQGLQNVAEWIVEMLYGLVDGVTGSARRTRHFLPFVATFFLFILLNNWLGLVPGVGTVGYLEDPKHAVLLPSDVKATTAAFDVRATETAPVTEDHATPQAPETVTHQEIPSSETPETVSTENHATGSEATETHAAGPKFVPYFRAGTADLNTTLALAIVSVFMTQVFGVQYLRLGYFGKFINFSSPIGFFVGLLEAVLELAKVISFAFRLFGNIFAGEVLLAVISFLVPVVAPMPFYGLEVVVGVIQALVFAMLSVVFFNMATIGHEDH